VDRHQHDNLATLLRIIADRIYNPNYSLDGTGPDYSLVGAIAASLGLDSAARDGFSRYRVSNPVTIFDSKLLFDKAPLVWDEETISGSGISSTWSKNRASVTLTSTNETACNFVRQTFQRFNYQPGKGNLVEVTGVLYSPQVGRTITLGQFDAQNGFMFRDDAGTYQWGIRSYKTGSPVDTWFTQDEWNIDKMDGTGPSGITADFTQNQIFIWDYQWLGVGRVRVGLDIDGKIFYCHEFNHANVTQGVYMSTPNLPLRWEMTTTADTPATSVEVVCGAVLSEGGSNDTGILRYESTNGAHVDANAADTWYPIIGIHLKTTHIGCTVKLASMSMINEQSQDFEWAIAMNPTVTGSPTWNPMTNSAVETMLGATAITVSWDTGIWFTGGMVKSGASADQVASDLENAVTLGSDISDNRDQIFLCARPLAINADIEATLSWREIQ